MGSIPAAKLVFLHEIPTLPDHTKVRILGCIRSYSPERAEMYLAHPPDLATQVAVNISVPLPTLAMGDIEDGVWYNVVGYAVASGDGRQRRVDAIRIWKANGMVDPEEWLRTVKEMRKVDAAIGKQVRQLEGMGRMWGAG